MFNIEDLIKQIQELNNKNIELEEENNQLKNILIKSQESSKKKTEDKESLQEQVIGNRVKEEKYFYIDHNKDIDWVLELLSNNDNDSYNSFNYFKNEEEAKKHVKHEFLSLKLIRLRDKLNNGWIPNWNNDFECKYFIVLDENKIKKSCYSLLTVNNLYFKTEKLRDEFLKLIPEEEILEYLKF